jgi:hypothetical protein
MRTRFRVSIVAKAVNVNPHAMSSRMGLFTRGSFGSSEGCGTRMIVVPWERLSTVVSECCSSLENLSALRMLQVCMLELMTDARLRGVHEIICARRMFICLRFHDTERHDCSSMADSTHEPQTGRKDGQEESQSRLYLFVNTSHPHIA